MERKKEEKRYILTIGIIVGVIMAATICISGWRGRLHMPCDNVSMLNMVIFSAVMILSSREYKRVLKPEKFEFKEAYIYISKINIISALIVTIGGYFYYSTIDTGAIPSIVDIIEKTFKEIGLMPKEELDDFIKLYRENLTPGVMAKTMLLMQIIGTAIVGLLLATFIRENKEAKKNEELKENKE